METKRDTEREHIIEYIHRNEQDITSHKHTFYSNKKTMKKKMYKKHY